MKVTVLTPTYNRGYLLKRLYKSLIDQKNKDFEWLIVDDGSSDGTKELIDTFIEENEIVIKYFYQENAGKHRALNYGIKLIEDGLTYVVDSDDYLPEDAIQIIYDYYNKYKDNSEICCFSFLKEYSNGEISGKKYRKNEFIGNYITDRLNVHDTAERAEVFITKYLKEEPFLEIEGEKFLSEAYVYVKLALKYKYVFINEVIYIMEYLDDGITKNMYQVRAKSPVGMIATYKVMYNDKANLYLKIKTMIKYVAYTFVAKYDFKRQFNEAMNEFMFIILYIPGYIFYKKCLIN